MQLPTEQQINTMAVELGMAGDDGVVLREHRSRVAAVLMEQAADSDDAPDDPGPEPTLLSRTVTKIDGGHIVVEVTLITN